MKAKKASARLVGCSDQKSLKVRPMEKRDVSHNTTIKNSYRTPSVYVCSGCSKPIKKDKFLLKACDKYWHENCLRCDRCHSRLGELGSTLYNKSEMNLCRQDYLEMFGETGICSVCEKHICASEMVMRAKQNVYHLECFACQLCNQRFCVGDRFYLCENKVVCQYDYEEHILPIQSSLLEQPVDSSGHQLADLISQSALNNSLDAQETFSIGLDVPFVIQNDDNSAKRGIDFHPDKIVVQPAAHVGEKVGLDDEVDDILLNEKDISKKDGAVEVKVVHDV